MGIEANYNKPLYLESAAKEVRLSASYFTRVFKHETGQNFSDFLIDLRMKKAKELFKDINYNISEIAHLVGYTDVNYFGFLFKKQTGLTPTQYREKAV